MSIIDISKIIFKSSFKKPATRRYPYEKRKLFKRTRGSIGINIDICIFCSLCARKCPSYAISVSKDDKTWSIDRLKCIACNYCVEVCPKKCLTMHNNYSGSTTKKEVEIFKQKSNNEKSNNID